MPQSRLITLVVVLGMLLVYMPATHREIVNYDDEGYVTENPTVKASLTRHDFKYVLAAQLAGVSRMFEVAISKIANDDGAEFSSCTR